MRDEGITASEDATPHGDQIEELQRATLRLAEQVAGLAVALDTVNGLRSRQLDQEQALRLLSASTTENQELGEHIITHLDSLDESAVRWRRVVVGVVAVVLVLTPLGFLYAGQRNSDMIHERNSLRVVCQQRNEGNAAALQYLDEAVARTKVKLTPAQVEELALLKKAFRVVDCNAIN